MAAKLNCKGMVKSMTEPYPNLETENDRNKVHKLTTITTMTVTKTTHKKTLINTHRSKALSDKPWNAPWRPRSLSVQHPLESLHTTMSISVHIRMPSYKARTNSYRDVSARWAKIPLSFATIATYSLVRWFHNVVQVLWTANLCSLANSMSKPNKWSCQPLYNSDIVHQMQ